jgi:hypothetical protein
MNNNGNLLYAFFDGDGIGDTLEILLLEGSVSEAIAFSERIDHALSVIETKLNPLKGIEIIILGGDDILIKYDYLRHSEIIDEIKSLFQNITGNSMSCGVGNSIPQAIQNLHLAKLYGKNQVRGIE